ncbi:Uncharacterised protein [Vibrio cholerae]|nr:Uncharacterised protein [Vibrio cholerae]
MFFGHLAVENHLKQQIPQLFTQVRPIALGDGIHHFKGFFDGVRCNGVEGLLFIPRATLFWVTQAAHDLFELFNRV